MGLFALIRAAQASSASASTAPGGGLAAASKSLRFAVLLPCTASLITCAQVHTATQRAENRAPRAIAKAFVVLQAPVFACILKFLISAPAVTHLQAELQPLYPVMMMVRDRHGTRAATTAWPSDGAVLLSRALPHSAAERPPRGLHP